MRRLILFVLVTAALGEDPDAWNRELDRIAAIRNDEKALARIAELERSLRNAEPTTETRERLAELLVRCKVARVDLLAKGATSIEAIGLLEAVLAEEPGRVGAGSVIASLWKVDDAATEALRGAQAHVRAQERWKAPEFWAGWQMWGLGG